MEEKTDKADKLDGIKKKLAKKLQRRADYLQKMKAADTFEKMFIYLRYQWKSLALLYVTLMVAGVFVIISARILWEIGELIWQISL